MGQRLVINIVDRDKRLANAYYHWSGYTYSALYLTQRTLDVYSQSLMHNSIINQFKKDPKNALEGGQQVIVEDPYYGQHAPKLREALLMLYSTGAFIQREEIEYFNKINPDWTRYPVGIWDVNDRNAGLISISDVAMDENLMWAEEVVTIDISDSPYICFGVLSACPMDEEWFKTEFGDWKIVKCAVNPCYIKMGEWNTFYNFMMSHMDKRVLFQFKDNQYPCCPIA